ncbi:WbqC family protein [Flavobacterium xinjiangense]|uniref:WbqC-like protein family protein n=1 Tax=Flavobacterium xinjiangense TaxID=178356 RepID=A0A1M7NJ08_9FLAO|nr:WbqC family protein [Flavobacterium xinjiangense]SHN03820.1 WbqC-like protein family protein [Flavobacterium xinjiangense]
MKTLLFPTYFPSISHFAALAQSENTVFEIEDNFQKQTNRNRTYIYSPNGIQLLNIPVKHYKESHQKTKDIQIETDSQWQKQHFKSLEAAYRSSPFFEFFEDDLRPIFEEKHKFLLDLNFKTIEILSKCLRMKLEYTTTTEYFHEVDTNEYKDFRALVNGKKDPSLFESYTQVFDDKYGFINNLSVLDLLFNEGKYALDYLKKQEMIIK